MTPQERGLTFCDDAMSQYEQLHAQSILITSDKATSDETRKFIIEQVNPKLNRLQQVIITYCTAAVKGTPGNPAEITSLITGIITLFSESKGVK